MAAADIVRELIDGLPGTATVTVRVDWLTDLLPDHQNAPPSVEVDLRCDEVATLLHRDASTIRQWCRGNLFPGAYRLHKREWCIPRSALAAFQHSQAALNAAHYRSNP